MENFLPPATLSPKPISTNFQMREKIQRRGQRINELRGGRRIHEGALD